MKFIHKILEYEGHIHMLCRYSQQMLAYNFTCIHIPSTMMRDVDALSRMHDPLVAAHVLLTSQLKNQDVKLRPDAYSTSYFDKLLSKGVYSIRKGDQRSSIEDTVQSLSHTLLRSNMLRVKDNISSNSSNSHNAKPAHVLSTVQTTVFSSSSIKREWDSVNYDCEISNVKRARSTDTSIDGIELKYNKVCFNCVQYLTTTKFEQKSEILINTHDRIAFYAAAEDECFAYDDTCIAEQDGIQNFLQSYQKTWLSLAPRIPTIAYHLQRILQDQIDVLL